MGISALPGLRQKVLTISCLAGARMLFTAVNWALGGFTPLNAVVLLVMLALEGLQLAGLWMCLSEDKVQRGLYIHWLYGRIVYILSWVLLALTGLTTLVMLFSALAGGKDGRQLLVVVAAALVTTFLALALTFYYKHRARLAKQLRQGAVTPSRAPEVWTLLFAASNLAMLLCQAAATLLADKAPLPEGAGSFAQSAHDFLLSLAQPNLSAVQHAIQFVASALLIATLLVVCALFKSVRINAPLLQAPPHKKRKNK